MELIEQKMNEYFNWLKQKYKYKQLNNSMEITTPFKNHINDYIRIYVDMLPNSEIKLSDDGLTLNELDLLGVDITTKTRERLIKNVLNQFSLELNNDEIIANVKNESFAQSKHNLIQGILKIYDLSMTTKSNVSNLFYEEVLDFFYDEDIIGSAKVAISGESGIKHSIDYILPATKSAPEKLINFANNLDFNKVTTDSYIYRDVKPNRLNKNNLEPKMLIIANDIENPITNRTLTVAQHENLSILKWSDKKQILSALTA
ncbi:MULTISPECIES: DUF1828 domain-containing protein [Staphylococcus]|uniref:DUF1828 domain-containing protein n=1 Tax=Staphylococcus sp. GDY8P47P TaxID=2804491 RepID=UPI0019518AD1|nr:DUF1828 domain-containing protein [Staphylococcus sp. GDY8P47P]